MPTPFRPSWGYSTDRRCFFRYVFRSSAPVGLVELAVTLGPGRVDEAVYVGWGRRFLCSVSWPRKRELPATSERACNVAKDVLTRLLGHVGEGASILEAGDPSLAKDCPGLHALMTRLTGPSGNSRQPCSMTIFCEDGLWKCCLTERDFQLSLWASSPTFYGLVAALEGRLGQETVEWRRKSNSSNGRPSKAK